ncbi:MAG: hypothetical protein CL693_01640 [Cellvibrionaceae bacterium]|nr:hypothetical protein [Cellvibrionaceae bacterium]|tara:strand:- start:6091 stop:6876 length:786 start_codon:yes stop_codon:yes gene_type:complete
MKALKIVLGLVVAVVAVAAIVVVIGVQNLDKIVKTAVEKVGPEVLGTEVLLSEVHIDITEGRGELRGLTVANPEGYSPANIFSLGQTVLDIDTSSLGGDVIVINEITIKGANLLAEQKGLKDTNLQALLDNIQSGSKSASSSTEPDQTSDASGSDVLLAVEKFTFADSNMKLVSEQFGEHSLTLPSIKLTDLGTKDKGLTPEELANAVVKPLLAQAKKAAQKRIEALAKEKAEEKINEKLNEKLGEDGAKKLNELKSLFGK